MPTSRDPSYDTTREVAIDRAAPTFVRPVDQLRERRNEFAALLGEELTASEARRVKARVAEMDREIAALEAAEVSP